MSDARGLASDQSPWNEGWYRVRSGLWRNRQTGEVWRGWRQYGTRAGHYPGATQARAHALAARAAETQFARQLRAVGRQISELVRGVLNPANPDDPGWDVIDELLRQYRELLRPWAGATAQRMLADVSRRDAAGWHQLGREIGQALGQEIASAPTQDAITDLYNYQVEQILKLPADAAERIRESRAFSAEIVQQMRGPAEEAMVAGRRWEDLMQKVRDEGLRVEIAREVSERPFARIPVAIVGHASAKAQPPDELAVVDGEPSECRFSDAGPSAVFSDVAQQGFAHRTASRLSRRRIKIRIRILVNQNHAHYCSGHDRGTYPTIISQSWPALRIAASRHKWLCHRSAGRESAAGSLLGGCMAMLANPDIGVAQSRTASAFLPRRSVVTFPPRELRIPQAVENAGTYPRKRDAADGFGGCR